MLIIIKAKINLAIINEIFFFGLNLMSLSKVLCSTDQRVAITIAINGM